MFITDCLSPLSSLTVVKPSDSIAHALKQMSTYKLLSMPVVNEDGTYYGTLSKRSLFEMYEHKYTGLTFDDFTQLPLADGVDPNLLALTTEHLYEDALPIIVRYPFVPIVDENNKFLGIIKRKDMELVLESVFGMGVKGTRMLLTHFEGKGILREISSILTDHEANVISCVSFDSRHSGVRRILVKFKSTDNVEEIKQDFENHGFTVTSIHE
ncbi:CBS domain-containing protein [Brevibacillus daliensis]|uniref:CBS domain-containing protein n=1 Tax=Brevibacillus daliensis TaxID=2892995 RepID=UPI001E2B36DB|nr:CBS domain-containing protein [Brevibacillus daliensis]